VPSSAPPAAPLRWVEPAPRTPSHAKALPLLRAAVEAAPERLEPRRRLAAALFQLGRLEELIAVLEPPGREAGAPPELLVDLGRAALLAGDEQLALTSLRRAAAAGSAAALGHLAGALLRLGRERDALDAALRGIEAAPADFKPLGVAARILLARGERRRLWEVCAGIRARAEWNPYLPSAMAHAAGGEAERAEVGELVDPSRWYACADDGGDLAARLSTELLAHPALMDLPATKSTAGAGSRIDQLHIDGGPVARELLGRIRTAVDAYAADRNDGGDHPMVATRPEAAVLSSWAVAVRRDGHEDWHNHPGGWLSGVYYASVPAAADARAGTIEFGPLPFGIDAEPRAWPRWRVRPRPGRLLLFPSHYGHRTWPTGRGDTRLCVAFDVSPARTDA
jgi:tetratricopeptide (TPR) repeat protein